MKMGIWNYMERLNYVKRFKIKFLDKIVGLLRKELFSGGGAIFLIFVLYYGCRGQIQHSQSVLNQENTNSSY